MSDDTATPAADASQAGTTGESTVNSQITDAVSMLATLTAGQAPATSAAMVSLMAAQSLALGMNNAVARQQADQAIQSATVAAICARMVGARLPTLAMPELAPDLLSTAEAQAQAAIALIKAQAIEPTANPEARAALERLAASATLPVADKVKPRPDAPPRKPAAEPGRQDAAKSAELAD